MARGFEVDPDHLAAGVVHAVGPGGNFLAEEHTVRHFRDEMWLAGPAWTRQAYDLWESAGGTSFADRLRERVQSLLATHRPAPLEEALAREIDRIVANAQREIAATS
jgi:trimethylamine--corrinoid protein Co-methyltransferase